MTHGILIHHRHIMISDVYLFFSVFSLSIIGNRHLSSNQIKLQRFAFLLFFSLCKQNSSNVRVEKRSLNFICHGTILMYENKSELFFAFFCVFTDIACRCVLPNSTSCISVPQVKKVAEHCHRTKTKKHFL